jgi:hypothetical protein
MKTRFIGCFLVVKRWHPRVDVAIAPPTAAFKNVLLDIPDKVNSSILLPIITPSLQMIKKGFFVRNLTNIDDENKLTI